MIMKLKYNRREDHGNLIDKLLLCICETEKIIYLYRSRNTDVSYI
jgi:hypothetical protein